MGWLRNTIATCEAFANAAAATVSAPSLYSTLAPGALARMYFSGEEGKYVGAPRRPPPPRPACWSAAGGGATALPPGEFTCAEPAPESTPTSACDPITAIDFRVAALNGNWLPALFSSTIDSSAIFCASSNPLRSEEHT